MKITRPMLADNQFKPSNDRDWAALLTKLPLLASNKLDGVRAIVQDGVVLSRTMKPIPNKHVQQKFAKPEFEGFDGELIVGDPTSPTCYRDTVSAVMSHEGEPNVRFYVFDKISDEVFAKRYREIQGLDSLLGAKLGLVAVKQHKCITEEELLQEEDRALKQGYEGLILRSMNGPYKQGRSTFREGYMIKLKRFVDSEAVVLGMVEKRHNVNEATTDERGYTKRSHAKSGMLMANTMGALMVRDLKTGVEFDIGTGFDDVGHLSRAWWWALGKNAIGMTIVYKSFPVGAYEKPRHPVFKGLRAKEDM